LTNNLYSLIITLYLSTIISGDPDSINNAASNEKMNPCLPPGRG